MILWFSGEICNGLFSGAVFQPLTEAHFYILLLPVNTLPYSIRHCEISGTLDYNTNIG
jgi:hypothetical protein